MTTSAWQNDVLLSLLNCTHFSILELFKTSKWKISNVKNTLLKSNWPPKTSVSVSCHMLWSVHLIFIVIPRHFAQLLHDIFKCSQPLWHLLFSVYWHMKDLPTLEFIVKELNDYQALWTNIVIHGATTTVWTKNLRINILNLNNIQSITKTMPTLLINLQSSMSNVSNLAALI